MGKPMNYGVTANTYASHRWALPWKLQPLIDVTARLDDRAVVLDVGCGTGDYLHALHEQAPRPQYSGFDISPEMLAHARSRCPWARLDVADADARFPAESDALDLVYAVDVLHHLRDCARFFAECARVLRKDRRLLVTTDSEVDIRARSLGRVFPATVPVNLQRYPAIEQLLDRAAHRGFRLVSQRTVQGYIDMDDRFMRTLATKALSELRIIPDDEHQRGMERAETLRAQGGQWLSQTTVLEWTLP
jgi:SAM-dependent methyltransferase